MTQQQLRILQDLRGQARRHNLAFRPFALARLRAVCDLRAQAEMRHALERYLAWAPDLRYPQRRAA